MSILSIYLIGCLVELILIFAFSTHNGVKVWSQRFNLSYREYLIITMTVSASWLAVLFWIYLFLKEFDWDKKPFGDD